ncbi:MAG: hypothetical protein ACFCD0_11440 [Gemmataceae bacterium]
MRIVSGFWVASLMALGIAQTTWADAPQDPMRLVPFRADIVAKVEKPRQAIEYYFELDVVQKLLKFEAAKEFLDSTNVRQLNQLLAYFEKELDADRYELIDKLAGGGVLFTAEISRRYPVLLILQGKDEPTTQKFFKLALDVVEEEQMRQGAKDRIKRTTYNGIPAARLGKNAYVAAMGSTIVLGNKPEVLKTVARIHLETEKNTTRQSKALVRARKMLPKSPLVWGWFNLSKVQNYGQFREAVKGVDAFTPASFTVLGPAFELLGRAPFVCGAISQEGSKYHLAVRFPSGMKGMNKKTAAFFSKKGKSVLPLLEPPNVLASMSYHLDPNKLWKKRQEIFPPDALQGLNQFQKYSGRFMFGLKLDKLLTWAGPHQRIVVTTRTKSVYKTKPIQDIPAFAFVHDMRDRKFGESLDSIFRTAALLATTQLKLKMVEKEINGTKIVSYRFPEKDKFPGGDPTKIRFNFSPSYASVGNQFIASSTLELATDLVKLLQKQQVQKPLQSSTTLLKFYSEGLAVPLRQGKDTLVAQAVLSQAQTPEQANKEVAMLIDLVSQLGTLDYRATFHQNNTTFDWVLDLKKPK